MASVRKKIFAWLLAKSDALNDQLYRSIKEELFKNIKGTVVEIGPGTGNNLRYLSAGINWIGAEPNESFHKTILAIAQDRNINASIISSSAESIPLPDESADAVISTLVLCSVPNQQNTLHEIKRILKKGGALFFIEHVADKRGTFRKKAQDIFNPLNRLFADGCSCNRETWIEIEKAGFSNVNIIHKMINEAMSLHTPHIFGYAVK